MKFFPDRSKKYKLKKCVCGKETENVKVNRSIYHNVILFTIIGVFGFLLLTVISFYTPLPTDSWIAWLIMAAILSYDGWQLWVNTQQGHNLWCALRRVMISVAGAKD